MTVTGIVGTEKGAWLLRGDDARQTWSLDGPIFKGWKVTAAGRDPAGRYLLATGSNWFGAAIHRSTDLAEWEQIADGPAWPDGGDRKLSQVWTLRTVNGSIYAGVDEAGLFVSRDGGDKWESVEGLNEHPSREAWQPGLGGLCAHAVLADPTDPNRMWCGISAVGVFRTDDGGATWHAKNDGVPSVAEDEERKDIGRCVHALAQDPTDPLRIYRREHIGMFRTTDGGDTWERIEEGLPSTFGFPLVVDPHTGTLFAVPLESDEFRLTPNGELRVYRSRDGGDSWEELGAGLPSGHYTGALRGAMAVDGRDPAGVYFGTTSGTLHVTNDLGDHWQTLPWSLPRILSVTIVD